MSNDELKDSPVSTRHEIKDGPGMGRVLANDAEKAAQDLADYKAAQKKPDAGGQASADDGKTSAACRRALLSGMANVRIVLVDMGKSLAIATEAIRRAFAEANAKIFVTIRDGLQESWGQPDRPEYDGITRLQSPVESLREALDRRAPIRRKILRRVRGC